MSIQPVAFNREPPPTEEEKKRRFLSPISGLANAAALGVLDTLEALPAPSIYTQLQSKAVETPSFPPPAPKLQNVAWKPTSNVIQMRVDPHKVTTLPDGANVHLYRLETPAGQAQPRDLPRNGVIRVCLHQPNGPCRPVEAPLPREVAQTIADVFRNDGPPGRCCSYLVNEIHGRNRPDASCRFEGWRWTFQTLEKGERLAPGDLIHLTEKPTLDHLFHFRKGDKAGHFAVHLGEGLFLSIYGNDGPLRVTDLEEMKKTYSAKHVYKITPKNEE